MGKHLKSWLKTELYVYKMLSIENKIWFCGFYEGEGSISNDKYNYNRVRISVSQNDITPLELGKSIWGRMYTKKNKTK